MTKMNKKQTTRVKITARSICSLKRGRELAAAGKKNDCDSPANTANGVCVCEMLPLITQPAPRTNYNGPHLQKKFTGFVPTHIG
ncbi:jg26781 [Pararge aegeria aegeria]|uniref:Jg26781 protein n=1 Tax=Pararge aegeria aegeria TaxID=348720 RepID=A0A8S4SK05_9NEOP|nr:jg26781 [Pararge aegeria aegeria]